MGAIRHISTKELQGSKLGRGMHADGNNLYLNVSKTGGKSWIFKYTFGGKRVEMGLGTATPENAPETRAKAISLKQQVKAGVDPRAARDASKSIKPPTWGEQALSYIQAQRSEWRTEKQAHIWEQSLRDYGPEWDMPVAQVDTAAIASKLELIWATKSDTAKRVRNRIERVWGHARVKGLVSGENPARWKDHLDQLLAKPSKTVRKKHHPAMPYAELPEFMAKLSKYDSTTAAALTFTILTAARTGETLGFDWTEDEGTAWRVPAERMKAGVEHLVPLSTQVRALLDAQDKTKPPFQLSTNTMLFHLQKSDKGKMGYSQYTVHGFRSSFSDWANEQTEFPSKLIEVALAHSLNKVEKAYNRGALLERRRVLMQAWADYCYSGSPVP